MVNTRQLSRNSRPTTSQADRPCWWTRRARPLAGVADQGNCCFGGIGEPGGGTNVPADDRRSVGTEGFGHSTAYEGSHTLVCEDLHKPAIGAGAGDGTATVRTPQTDGAVRGSAPRAARVRLPGVPLPSRYQGGGPWWLVAMNATGARLRLPLAGRPAWPPRVLRPGGRGARALGSAGSVRQGHGHET